MLTEDDNKRLQKEPNTKYKLTRLSFGEETWIASEIHSYVVKIKNNKIK